MINLSLKHILTLFAVIFLLAGCTTLTTTLRYTESGDQVAIGQFPPKPESECVMVHNEELEQSLIERYTDTGMMMNAYANSEKMLALAENKSANYVHFYIPPKKMLFGIIDLNYGDKLRATYYQCKELPYL
ncbi:hypothetical protein [uncultured Endozoicomonas sp.]|uniref:hypothetical protein n=1 Tax=uncultured Endozoicomonas sp. TaxID=432652 RepID=UPI00261138D8|nr:hypothetical protein [uncultured Endozoicomonas sp.]